MKENRPLVSIIVPIYNVEDYLRPCLDSLIAQTYDNIEIILIDDGSPDSCCDICKEYANADGRIVYVRQENAGLSAARNKGLEIYHGEYVLFVDSDDWVSVKLVDSLLSLALKYDVPFVAGGYERVRSGRMPKTVNSPSRKSLSTGKEYARLMARPMGVFCFAWGRLIHRDLMKDFRFPVGKVFEDVFVMPRIVYPCKNIAVTTETLYFYRIRNTSISHKRFSLKALDEMDAYIALRDFALSVSDKLMARYACSFFLTKYYYYYLKVVFFGFDIKEYRRKYIDEKRKSWHVLL